MGHQARLMARAGHTVTLVAGRGAALDGSASFVSVPLLDSRHPRVLAVKAQLDAGHVTHEFQALVGEIETALLAALVGQDIVLAHNVCSLHKNLALTAALHNLNGRPDFPRLVLWHHDLAWTANQYRAELHAGYPWDLLRQAWPAVRQVVVSETRRQQFAQLTGLPPEQISVVPNGVDVPTLLKLSDQTRALAAALRLEDAAPILLLPARLTPRKNVELALRTLAALHTQPDVQGISFKTSALVVTGPEGPHNPANAAYRQRLLALRDELGLAGSAHFAIEHSGDVLPDDVVADLYRLADALFMPSREEGFGIPLLEAGLTRQPVFCADIGPLQALGGDDVTYFSPDADPRAVAAIVAQGLGANANYRFAVRVRQVYGWQRIYANQIEPLLR